VVIAATVVQFLAMPAAQAAAAGGEVLELPKAAPYFRSLDTEVIEVGRATHEVGGTDVQVRELQIDQEVSFFEATWHLDDVLSDRAPDLRAGVAAWLRDHAGVRSVRGNIFEEYVVICVAGDVGSPDEFVDANPQALGSLIRADPDGVSAAQAATILASRVRHSDADLAVVDWDGAVVIDRHGNFGSDLALLTLGNTQLLQYRMLDHRINQQLAGPRRQLTAGRGPVASRRAVREILQTRLDLLLDYEEVEQLVALIGDWYTADLYRVIIDELYVDEWKTTVRAKLDELQAITDSAGVNLAVSWQQRLDLVQLIGWGVLLVGYFVLFVLEGR
jgi:hypothetical protein